MIDKIKALFNSKSKKNHNTDFIKDVSRKFNTDTVKAVVEAFEKLNLPLPEMGREFLIGNEGNLVFLNKYGLVIRIEPKKPKKDFYKRIDDSAWILTPLLSIDSGDAVVEICPGCKVERDFSKPEYLFNHLAEEGLHFHDDQLENTGRIPAVTPNFPEGIPIVIDRLAVRKLTDRVSSVKTALAIEAKNAREVLYAPLVQAFKDGLSDNAKMKDCWALCEKYTGEGKLVAGWKNNHGFYDKIDFLSKTSYAEFVADSYARKLKSFEKKNAKIELKQKKLAMKSQ